MAFHIPATLNSPMKINVIIPFYRELDLIARAVDSVLLNTNDSLQVEVLICNDGPIPEEQIRDKLGPHTNRVTRIIENRHPKGPGGARNTGLDAADGDVVAFLDADDFWLPGKLDAQLAEIKMGATFVATAYRFDSSRSTVSPPRSIEKPLDVFLSRGIGTSTVMLTRDLISDLRFKNIRFAQDIDYWYALAQSPAFVYHAIDVCGTEYSTGGSTKNKWVQLQYLNKVLLINELNFLNRARVITSYVIAGVYNHYFLRIFQSK